MFRLIGMFGLGAIFLAISPSLRGSLLDIVDAAKQYMIAREPWSYVAAAFGLLFSLMLFVRLSSRPRG